jgi:uncharacterized protein YaaQ
MARDSGLAQGLTITGHRLVAPCNTQRSPRAHLEPREVSSFDMSDQLKLVTSVSNEAEAEMVAERLSEAGIRFTVRLASGGIRLGAAAARDLYVDEQDLDRAREALDADEGFTDEELARLSDEAGGTASDQKP